jgi:hypothetical protein
MDIWSFNRLLTKKLRSWAAVSILAGILLQFTTRLGKGIGVQFIGWGLINYLIAKFGNQSTAARFKQLENPYDQRLQAQEKTKLYRLLLINSGLDILYMLGGFRLASTRGRTDDFRKGNGFGIVFQGGFLLVFDLFQAFTLKRSVITRADDE